MPIPPPSSVPSRPEHTNAPVAAPALAVPFDAVVFAGGGCRCFWQLGFWQEAAPVLGLRPRVVAAVSAGAAFASAVLTDHIDQVVADFKRRTARNQRNAYPRNVLTGAPVFPHEGIYRGALLESLNEDTWQKLRSGPDLQILLARPASWMGPRVGFMLGGIAFALDRRELRVHARWGERFGFCGEVVSAHGCDGPKELAELILQSSCTPPLLPLYRRGPRIVLDGGLIDNAPASLVAGARSTLVLLTRHYPEPELPRMPGRTYVCPSRSTPIEKWDYTSPELIQRTFDLGRRDGEQFAALHRRSSGRDVAGAADRRWAS
ncbi:MAG: patatin-like phospholipase family protein [Deltaproteobacteria bacterium]|jgi:predicted acylesterase/phospholipase RssA|nr:patatin-like phospholipase family protein [Deltaproteobacteria bacterium]